jgi:NADH-ubiquinone oxidoreductase chain 5
VCLIRGRVVYYCNYYIDGEKNLKRFLYILLIFVGSILILIVRVNLFRIIIGWDGLGLTSYLLVIYYQNESSFNAGILTVMRNRVGDALLLIGIGLFVSEGRWRYGLLNNTRYILIFLIIVGAITKRAQLPFRAWLPAAIAAPTPVSSLVHSSTLVTAGVYLIIRFYHLVRITGKCFLFLVGAMTIIMAGFSARFETDSKKVIAFSTLRQLGVIFIAIGLGMKIVALFHLVRHAFFKARLFIGAGVVIHSLRSQQDIRVGRNFMRVPALGGVFGLTNIALCGGPYLTGFYSKDEIIENYFVRREGGFIWLVGLVRVGLTIGYRSRLIYGRYRYEVKLRRVRGLGGGLTLVVASISILLFIRVV